MVGIQWRLCLLFAAICLGVVPSKSLADVRGQVVGVADGDTLTILEGGQQHKIRLTGIDAPERAQPFGDRSRAALGAFAFGKPATARCHKRDRYGRDVCVVVVEGMDVGLEQVRSGWAWWYRDYAKEQVPEERASYAAAETDSKLHRRGLWSDALPVAPWEWRRSVRASR